ncbi:hypothetical protein AMECASPLE_014222 [Ameca splendens]|uniref:Uncharacterized protein n=1 Tax=Ameca splendens TaxID=208324 RepID=A0ABV0ZLF0_9TELE
MMPCTQTSFPGRRETGPQHHRYSTILISGHEMHFYIVAICFRPDPADVFIDKKLNLSLTVPVKMLLAFNKIHIFTFGMIGQKMGFSCFLSQPTSWHIVGV